HPSPCADLVRERIGKPLAPQEIIAPARNRSIRREASPSTRFFRFADIPLLSKLIN
ncbi:MAG: hypothetical protein ACI9VS_002781, partial [Candidatus Binatia bacterium]